MVNKYNFEFELSNSSIQGLIRELSAYQNDLVNSKNHILQALADYTYERVKYYISTTVGNGGYPSKGDLLNSIQKSKIFNNMVRVFTDLAYAKYVEYGTGVRGSHPQASEVGWKYDSNGHGEDGWIYQAEDGNYYWTEGEEAHEFMYNAYLDLKNNYLGIARNVLRERGLLK